MSCVQDCRLISLVMVLMGVVPAGPLVAQTTPLRIATYNIENFDGRSGSFQFEAALDVIERINPDIICLQEIVSINTLEDLARDAGYPYYWFADRAGGVMDSYHRSAIMSRFQLIDAYTLHAFEISGDSNARDISRNFSVMHIDLPGPGPQMIAISNHWMSGAGDNNEFLRDIETQRVLQIMEAWDSAATPYFFGADMNDDFRDPPRDPRYFDSVPDDMPVQFNLGVDIEFPVWNSVFGPLRNARGSEHVNIVDAWQLDGTDGTHFGRARLDYLYHGDAMETIGSEVYDSNDEDLGGGLIKYGDPLPPETSRNASDHLLVFADVLVTNAMVLEVPLPGVAGRVNSIEVSLAEPGSRVYYLAGFGSGFTSVPGCPGLVVSIGSPMVVGQVVADAAGGATLEIFVPGRIRGRTVYIQAVDPAWCSVTNLVVTSFR